MITDIRSAGLPDSIECDVAIVGAGAAGIVLALELARAGRDVIVLEAGGDKFDPLSQAFYHAEAIAPDTHGPVHMFRRRVLGGSTSVWGGRCIPFDPIDFETRPWMPYAKWPIGYDDVAKYYPRATEYTHSGPAIFDAGAALPGEPAPMVGGVDSPDVVLDRIERFSHPTHFGVEYRAMLERDPRIRLFLHAPVERILTRDVGAAAAGVRVHAGGDRRIDVMAPCVILATGGLEIPRLLLASDQDRPKGLGNEHDLVGRFYQGHIEGEFGTIAFTKPTRSVRLDYQQSPEGIYCRRYIWLSPEAQRQHQLAGIVLRPAHPNIVDPGHRHPVLSAMYLVKNYIVPEYARKLTALEYQEAMGLSGSRLGFWAAHARNMVLGAPKLMMFSQMWTRKRILSKRKLPSVVLRDPREVYPVDLNAEQEPNPDSRITLGDARDDNGMRRIRIDWRTTEGDHRRLAAGLRVMAAAFADSHTARLNFSDRDYAAAAARLVPIGGHHIGTARMAEAPQAGVCDANCELFETRGVYIAEAAAFSTSGFANPTLTLIALALRLADHLKAQPR